MSKAVKKVLDKALGRRPLDFNFASNEDYAQATMNMLVDIWRIVFRERREREERWKEGYRAWTVDQTDIDSIYQGRADLNLPQIRKEVETMSRRIVKGLFPDNFLDATPIRLENEDVAEANAQVTEHYIANVMKAKGQFGPWVKQGVIYGTSPLRSFWKTDVNEQFFRERFFINNKQGVLEPRFKKVRRPVTTYDAPCVRAEDLMNTWVYPHNVSHPDQLEMVFWRTKIRRDQLLMKVKEGAAHKSVVDQIKDTGKSKDLDFEQQQEKFQQFGVSGELVQVEGKEMFDLLEIWCSLLLPGEKVPVPVVVEIINEAHVTRIQRNPYWHQKPPFDFMRFIVPPAGEFYGRGLPEASIKTQHQLNATLNQTMDSATLSLNNITVINPAFAPNAESFELEPGAQWWADPAAVKQFEFPDLSQNGMRNVAALRQIITEMSDNSPQLPDPIAGKARSTGQAQLAVNEWQTDLFSFMEQISDEALNPFAHKIHVMLQQYLPDDQVIRVAGRNSPSWTGRIITPEQLVGNFNFIWKGSLQIENQAIKTQQALNFMRVIAQLPPEAKVKIRWDNFVRTLLKDGIQMKDSEFMVETTSDGASTEPGLENKILELGGSIVVNPSDDDDLHITSHRAWAELTKSNFVRLQESKHIRLHEEQKEAKRQEALIQQLQLAQLQAQAQPQGPAGNPSDIPQSTDQADLERGQGL
jgi:hypothetical protein